MPARRAARAALVVVGALAALLVLLRVGEPLAEDELARRIAECEPAWSNYDEDLKAQLGAAPVAQWEGSLVGMYWEPCMIVVTFSLTGPWAEREAAIPILLQSPTGETLRHEQAYPTGAEVKYRFPAPCDAPPQWINVRYPFYGERRIVLSEEGRWDAFGG